MSQCVLIKVIIFEITIIGYGTKNKKRDDQES
jgi:hypothetical protein